MGGILKFAAMGAAEGLGRGVAQMGSTLGQEALMNERYKLSQERDKERDELMRERMERNQSLYLARLEAKGEGGSSGGKGAGSAVSQAQALANMPEEEMGRMLRQRMGDAEQVQSYLDHVYRGKSPAQPMTLDPQRFADPSKYDDYTDPQNPVKRDLGGTPSVPKYEDGQWRQIMDEAGRALHEAFKLSNPAHADDLAKGRATDAATDAALKYGESGKREDLGLSLALQGKDPEAAATAARGRVDAAKETSKGRGAAAAAKPGGGAAGGGLRGDESLKALESLRKSLDGELNVADRQRRAIIKEAGAAYGTRRDELNRQATELSAQMAALRVKRADVNQALAKKGGLSESRPPSSQPPSPTGTTKNGSTWTLERPAAGQPGQR